MLQKTNMLEKSYSNKRVSIILSGVLSSTTCGMLLYAFSVLVDPLNESFGWSCSEIALAFSICCSLSCISCFPAGILSDKIGPRPVVLLGGILTGTGFFLSAFVTSRFQFYITYGLLAGLGSGFLYLPPLTNAPKWWPDKPFLSTGFAVVGLGIGSFFMSPLATWIILHFDWKKVFIWCGLLMLLMGIGSSMLVSNPPELTTNKDLKESGGFSHKETTRTYQFWLLYVAFFCGETAGLTVVSQLAPFAIEIGYSSMKAAYLVSIFSMSNAFSRILSGFFTEKINLETYFSFVLLSQSIAILFLYYTGNYFLLVSILVFLIGWGFGTMAVLFPSIVIKFFGKSSHSSNYGFMLTACAIAGLCGPFFSGIIKESRGSYFIAFLVGSTLSLLASGILFTVKSVVKHVE